MVSERAGITEVLKKSPFRIFLFTLIFSPLAFGTVEPWSLFIMETSVFAAVCIIVAGRGSRKQALPYYEVPGLLPLMLLLAYIGFQLLPLPPELLRILSPATHSLYQESAWIGQPAQWAPLSINTKATLAEFFRFASYAGIYVLAVQLLAHAGLLKKTVRVIMVFGAGLALFAIMQHLLSNGRIYGIRELTGGGLPFGPYVNRNHYAGLMGMIFPVIMGLFLYYRPKVGRLSFREQCIGMFTHPQTNMTLLLGFAAVLTATSIFLSLSRGGIASLLMSLVFLGFLLKKKSGQARRSLLYTLTIILILYAVGWFGWGPIFERFRTIRNVQGEIAELRLDIWKDSLHIIRDFPVTGTGFGSYVNSYPTYRTIDSEKKADHAHNDYVELLADGGAVSMTLLIWFIAAVAARSYRVFQMRKDPYSLYLYSGILTGIISILLHGMTDFNLQIGANGLYLFFMLGMAVSASHTRVQDDVPATLLRTVPDFPARRLLPAVCYAVLLLCIAFYAGRLIGASLHSTVRDLPLNSTMPGERVRQVSHTLGRASFFDPLDPEYHYRRALAETLSSNAPVALHAYRTAVRLSPVSSDYLQGLGLFLWKAGDDQNAGHLLRAGISRDRKNPVVYQRYAVWLAEQGRKADSIGPFRTALSLEPLKIREYITAMVIAGLSDRDIMAALPEHADAYGLFADYLEKTGNDEMASEAHTAALAYAAEGKQSSAEPFHRAYQFYLRKDAVARAATIIEKASELFPRDPLVRLRLAEVYEKNNLRDRALEQYRFLLGLDPNNESIRQKVRALQEQ